MQTPLELLIEYINGVNPTIVNSAASMKYHILSYCKGLLEIEKDLIIYSYDSANYEADLRECTNGEEYFDKTFKTE